MSPTQGKNHNPAAGGGATHARYAPHNLLSFSTQSRPCFDDDIMLSWDII
jgi:hypothetical protein